jgi:ketosteroid isomerase-like protein
MTPAPAVSIVQDYHRAWTSGDVERVMAYVADDISCRAPGGDLTGKPAHRAYIAGFAPALTGLADITGFADGDRVALFYYPQTAATATAPAAECFTVRDGKIVESVLVFDRLSFGPPPGNG